VIHQVAFDDRTNSVSNNVRVELGQLADAYGVQPPKPSSAWLNTQERKYEDVEEPY